MKVLEAADLEVGKTYKSVLSDKVFKLTFIAWDESEKAYKAVILFLGKSYTTYFTSHKFELIETQENQMSLLQIKGTETYGIQLAINSAGKAVLEVKGTGEILTVDPSLLEEVIPYSVGVKFVGNDSHKVYHYWAKDGSVKEGDIVFMPRYNQFVHVIGVNTKSRAATKFLEGVVMQAGSTIGG